MNKTEGDSAQILSLDFLTLNSSNETRDGDHAGESARDDAATGNRNWRTDLRFCLSRAERRVFGGRPVPAADAGRVAVPDIARLCRRQNSQLPRLRLQC